MSALVPVLGALLRRPQATEAGGIVTPPTLPGSWSPAVTADWTSINDFVSGGQHQGFILSNEAGSWRSLPSSEQEGVSTGGAVGRWENHRDLGNPTGGGYNDPASGLVRPRPIRQTVDGVDCLRFNGDQTVDLGQRMRIPDFNWPAGHLFILATLWGAQVTDQEHTLFAFAQKLRLYARRTSGLASIRTNAGVYHDAPATGWSLVNAWRMIELQWSASTVRWRMDNTAWVTLGAFDFNLNEIGILAAHYYVGPGGDDGQPGKVAIGRMLGVNTVMTDEEAEPWRRYVAAPASLTNLDPEEVTPPPIDPPPANDDDDYTGILASYSVFNATQLQDRLDTANPGDRIWVEDGTYAANFTCSRSGTAANPIRVMARNFGQAVGFRQFTITGSYVRLDRLSWSSYSGGDSIVELIGQHARVHRCRFTDCGVSNGAQRGIVRFQPGANDCRVTYTEFRRFSQRAIAVRTVNGGALRAIQRRNYFKENVVASPFSGVAVGYGGDSDRGSDVKNELFGLVEYNLVEDVGGGMGNILQAKTSRVTFQFNTARNCPNAFMQVRQGFDCDFIANAILSSGGPLLQGARHRLIGNYHDAGASGSWRDMGPQGGDRDPYSIGDSEIFSGQTWAADCLCAGNIGVLRLGGGSSGWQPTRNNIVEAHQGSVVVQNAINTTYRGLSVTVPAYQILQPADVGPLAP